MAEVVHVKAPDLVRAAAAVAEHLETAAKPATAAAKPPPVVASPVDAAASGAAGAIHTKMAALSAEIAPRGPAIRQAGATAAGSLQAQDAVNAARMPSVPSPPSMPSTQALDHGWKRGPDQPGGPYDPNPRFPGRNNLGHYGGGNSGSADGAAAAEKRLKDYEDEEQTKVVRQQIKVQIIDPKTGQPMLDPDTGKPLSRFYDALDPVPGEPGKYKGIEVKSGTSEPTRNQTIFDKAVSPQTPATGTLNGEPVEVIRAEELRAPQFIPEPSPSPEQASPEPSSRAPIEAPPPGAAVKPAPVPPMEGGLGAGPSEPAGPHLISPGHHQHHVVGDWDPDPEEVP
jgi:hypothetical protein